MSVLYHKVEPQLVKGDVGHDPLELLDFELVGANRKIVAGSVRFEGQVEVTQANVALAQEDIKFDCRAGVACFIESVTTSFSKVGQVEASNNYSRLIAMNSNAKESAWDMVNSDKSCELKSVDNVYSNALLRKPDVTTNPAGDNAYSHNPDFSHRLFTCLNRVSTSDKDGDNSIPMNKVGAVRVSIQLARVFDALHGMDCDATTNFVIKNPTICFTSIPDDGSKSNLMMRVESSIKSSLNSSHAVISTRVPVVANGCSVSFQQLDHESSPTYNNVTQEPLPALTETVFLFNNASNEHITYTIRDRAEVLDNYLDSMKVMGGDLSTSTLQLLKANKSFGLGLPFEYIDLSKQAFNIQLDSGVSNATPYTAYLYFHGIIEL